ncbi:hypothetical protein J2Z60_000338 [Lactobacillus colini]|uniref:Phage protein n=1 Tax=Lactobacillus colini TaxID=1819254 RepID=A0ABS4MBZ8_9LACO|nr:hypothetical protein [Lactobacillus colini]MBP2057176.1 hypothetical protein [Lactobacillus colini]
MKFDFLKLMDKKIKLIDDVGHIFIGVADGYEDPENSEDGLWYLNVDVPDFGLLNISEPEIKSIEVLNG